MDDEEVLLDNDPLAIYLKNENIHDFETAELFPLINNHHHELKIDDTIFETCELSQLCLEIILKSELLLEEDFNTLDLYVSNNIVAPAQISTSKRKIIIFGSMALINAALFKYTNLKYVSMFSLLCAIPLTMKLYHFTDKTVKKRVVTSLVKVLNKCANTFKKYIRYISELSTTIGYYSSATITNSSINNAYIRFVKNVYGTLLNIIKELAFNSTKIISLVPLKIENNLQYTMKEDLFLKEDINITDLKILFELYLLVQSDFVKTLGLSLCKQLWKNPSNNINNVLKMSKKLTSSLDNYSNNLEKEYQILRNYGTSKNIIRPPKKVNNTPSDHMISCLYSTELHFQQLLCKSRDVQNILTEMKSLQEDEKTKIISTMLFEMEKQLFSCKNMLDSVTKYFYQIQNKTLEIDNKVTMPQPISNPSLKSIEDVERDLTKQDKLTYELYIPKEGLPLSELEVDTEERAVFSVKNLDYSNVLLQELRTILKARNPEIFEEQQQNKVNSETSSESDDEVESLSSRRSKTDIFRPIQPVGLAENLQTISQVIAARKNMLRCEEICEDTFGSSGSSGSSDIEES